MKLIAASFRKNNRWFAYTHYLSNSIPIEFSAWLIYLYLTNFDVPNSAAHMTKLPLIKYATILSIIPPFVQNFLFTLFLSISSPFFFLSCLLSFVQRSLPRSFCHLRSRLFFLLDFLLCSTAVVRTKGILWKLASGKQWTRRAKRDESLCVAMNGSVFGYNDGFSCCCYCRCWCWWKETFVQSSLVRCQECCSKSR